MAFVKTNDRAEGVRKALALLAINPVVGKRVFLKPNFNSSDPTPGSTHMDTLAAFVAALKEMGAQSITVGDRSGMGETRRVMEQLGVFRLAEELDFDVIVFDELAAADWVMVEPTNSHWEQGFPMARPALEAEALVQTCCLKTHRYGIYHVPEELVTGRFSDSADESNHERADRLVSTSTIEIMLLFTSLITRWRKHSSTHQMWRA